MYRGPTTHYPTASSQYAWEESPIISPISQVGEPEAQGDEAPCPGSTASNRQRERIRSQPAQLQSRGLTTAPSVPF